MFAILRARKFVCVKPPTDSIGAIGSNNLVFDVEFVFFLEVIENHSRKETG